MFQEYVFCALSGCLYFHVYACVCINMSDKHMEDSCYTHLLFHKQMDCKCQFSVTHQALIIGKSTCLLVSTSCCIPPVIIFFFPFLQHDTQQLFDWRVTQSSSVRLLSHMTQKLLGRSFYPTLDCQIIIS